MYLCIQETNYTYLYMKYRIQDICKEKGILMKDLAEKMGRTPESLSRSLNNGTTTKMLEEIAATLGVKVVELIEGYPTQSSSEEVVGAIRIGSNTHVVNSKDDIKKLAEKL